MKEPALKITCTILGVTMVFSSIKEIFEHPLAKHDPELARGFYMSSASSSGPVIVTFNTVTDDEIVAVPEPSIKRTLQAPK